MNLSQREEVSINCQKIEHTERGVSIVKLTVNDGGRIKDHYVFSPLITNYSNDHDFITSVLTPIVDDFEQRGKNVEIGFNDGFPILEALKYNADNVNKIKDKLVKERIKDIQDHFNDKNVNIIGKFPLKDKNKYSNNNEFKAFRNKEEEIVTNRFHEIVYTDSYTKKYIKERDSHCVYIFQHTNADLDQNYIVDFYDKNGKVNEKSVFQFQSEIEKNEFFSEFFDDLKMKKSKTVVYNNDPSLKKYKDENTVMVKVDKPSLINKYVSIIKDEKFVNYLKEQENAFSLNPRRIAEKISIEKRMRPDVLFQPLFGKKSKNLHDEIKESLSGDQKEISHIMLDRIVSDNNENIFALIIENKISPKTNKPIFEYNYLMLDLKSGNDDKTVFEKFKNIYESKMGTRLSKTKASRAQVYLNNFSDRKEFQWRLREETQTDKLFLGTESGTLHADLLSNYIKSNLKNIEIKNNLLAQDGPTDKETLCVYSDASIFKSVKDGITYGAVIRKPNSDQILCEIKGIKKFDHEENTNAAEEIGIIESMRTLKNLINTEQLPKDLKIEFRVDNIYAVQSFSGKNGMDKKVTEMYSSDIYTYKEVNELLRFFGNSIDFKWIKGHCNDPYNEKADSLAKSAWDMKSQHGYKKYGSKKVVSEIEARNIEVNDLKAEAQKEIENKALEVKEKVNDFIFSKMSKKQNGGSRKNGLR